MFKRCARLVLAAAVAAVSAVSVHGDAAQAPAATSARPAAANAAVKRTPWGDPDLQGIWTNTQDALTPFERPREMGNREFLTEAEFAKKVDELKGRIELRNGGTIWYEPFFGEPSRRTSQIIDPPDGRIPAYTAEGQRRVNAMLEARKLRGGLADTARDASLWSRCLTRTLPGAWIPLSYNNNRQILQTPGYVVIVYEEIHDVRIIPLDRRPRLGSEIRQWFGDSRGRWDGTTLVVEVTNFRNLMNFKGSPSEAEDIPVGPNAKLTERFRPMPPNGIEYTATIEDPDTFERSWTLDIPMYRDNTQTQILEYSCHEGNRSLEAYLSGSRASEGATRAPAR